MAISSIEIVMSFIRRTRTQSLGFRFKTLSLAVATALLHLDTHAAGLGDLTVQSFLGQPLHAEVEVISTPADGDAPVAVRLAPYAAFQKANVEFNQVLHGLRFVTEQRGDRKVIRITSSQAVNEPFLDVLLEVRSNNTAVVREYVFLLDPAPLNPAQTISNTSTAAPRTAAKPAQAPAVAVAEKVPVPAKAAAEATPQPTQKKTGNARPAGEKTAVATGKPRLTLSSPRFGTSAADDEAARAGAREYASMEQTVAEANARVKALEEKVATMQKLLEATNSLLAAMQEQKRLEQLSTQGKTAVSPAPAASSSPQPAATPAIPTTAASTATPAASAATEVTPNPADAKTPGQASTPAASPTPVVAQAAPTPMPKPAAKPVPVQAETAWWDNDFLLFPGVALVLAGLGAIGIRTLRRRKQSTSFSESVLADTTVTENTIRRASISTLGGGLSSLLPTGLSSDEVDAVAEADVYIAYGRDVQAEELLKEALRTKPGNPEISLKLMTIYATRKDCESFESLARELYRSTRGEGDIWSQVAEMGRGIDAGNPLYIAKSVAATPARASQAIALDLDDDADDADDVPAKPLLEMVLEHGDKLVSEPAPPLALTEEEAQLVELPLAVPAQEDIKTELVQPAAEAAMDVDVAMKLLDEPAFPASGSTSTIAEAEAKAEASIGPIDFEVIVPEIPAAEKAALVPEIPAEALNAKKEGTNLIEFDFLEPAAPAAGKIEDNTDALPEIPLVLPVETASETESETPKDEADLFKLEFIDEGVSAADKRN